MKKLSSMAALGLALALTFGMTVSAAESATTAGVAPEIKQEQVKEYEDKSAALTEAVGSVTATVNGQSVTMTKEPVKPATLFEAEQIATDMAKEKAAELNLTVSDNQKIETKVVGSADIKLPEGTVIPEEGITLDISISGIAAGKTYVLLHLTTDENGKPVWETIVPDAVVDGKVTATFKSFSPVIANEVTLVEVGEEGAPDEWLEPRHPEQAQSAPAPGTSPKTAETLPVAGVMALICLAGAAVCAGRIRYNK